MDKFYKRLASVRPEVVPLVKKLAEDVPLKPSFTRPKSDYVALKAQLSNGEDILLAGIYPDRDAIAFGHGIEKHKKSPEWCKLFKEYAARVADIVPNASARKPRKADESSSYIEIYNSNIFDKDKRLPPEVFLGKEGQLVDAMRCALMEAENL